MQKLTIGGNTKRSRFPAQVVEVPDFAALPETSRDFIVAYGLRQYIADGMAGASDEADAKAGIAQRVANLTSGDFKRTRGDALTAPDTAEVRAIKLAKAMIRDQLKAANQTADKDAVADAARKLLAMDDHPIAKKLKAEAKRQVDAEAKARDEAKADAGDILSTLGLGEVDADADEKEEDEEEEAA